MFFLPIFYCGKVENAPPQAKKSRVDTAAARKPMVAGARKTGGTAPTRPGAARSTGPGGRPKPSSGPAPARSGVQPRQPAAKPGWYQLIVNLWQKKKENVGNLAVPFVVPTKNKQVAFYKIKRCFLPPPPPKKKKKKRREKYIDRRKGALVCLFLFLMTSILDLSESSAQRLTVQCWFVVMPQVPFEAVSLNADRAGSTGKRTIWNMELSVSLTSSLPYSHSCQLLVIFRNY